MNVSFKIMEFVLKMNLFGTIVGVWRVRASPAKFIVFHTQFLVFHIWKAGQTVLAALNQIHGIDVSLTLLLPPAFFFFPFLRGFLGRAKPSLL